MTKKRHHEQPHLKLSKHEESRIERQTRVQRIIVIASAIFLGVVLVAVGVGLYVDRVAPLNATVLRVNGRSFTLGYYIDTMKLYTSGMDASQLAAAADSITSGIVRDEIIRQAAPLEGVVVTSDEVDAEIERVGLDKNRVTRDLAQAALATQAMEDKFKSQLPAELEQVRFEIMLVESRSAASEVEAATATGASLVDLSEQYSVTDQIPVVQDWVPYELLANKDVSAACQTLEPGGTSTINDPTAVKNLGYWLIEVIDRDDVGAIKTRAILAGSLEDALRAKTRLANGEDFVTVAEQYSQIFSATENAEFDWITPENVITEAFNAAAFELELNVVSEPIVEREIQTNGAYWVVRLLERDTRVLSETISGAMASVDFDAWYSEYSQTAVVEQLLTPEQKAFAVERATS